MMLNALALKNLLLGGAHTLQEGFEGHVAVVILRFAQLLHQGLGLLLGQLLTEGGQETEQLISNDGVVSIFVIKLQDLNEVVEATLVLGVLTTLVHGEDISLYEELLSLGVSSSNLLDGLQGWVEVAGTDEVSNIEGINLAITLEVVDIKGKINGVNLLLLKSELGHLR